MMWSDLEDMNQYAAHKSSYSPCARGWCDVCICEMKTSAAIMHFKIPLSASVEHKFQGRIPVQSIYSTDIVVQK